ncbi:DUF4369 domain-containing protein [Niabella aquatica]
MKKILLTLICVITVVSAKSQEFIIEGKVNGNQSDNLAFRYLNSEKKKISDTIPVINGRFSVTGTVNGCSAGILRSLNADPRKDISCIIFLEPAKMTITYDYGNVKAATIEGSASQKEYERLNNSMEEATAITDAYIQKINAIRVRIEKGDLDANVGADSIKALYTNTLPAINFRENQKLTYIAHNPDSYVSMDMLVYQIARIADEKIDSLYANLTDKVKFSTIGDEFIASYARYKKAINTQYPFEKINIGEKAPGFAYLKTNSKDSINDQSLNGKVYLIEFWDLGCLPCLRFNIEIEKIRKQYERSGFEVIGVSRTSPENLTQVKAYLKKSHLSAWRQVSINKEMKTDDDLMYRGSFDNYHTLEVPRSVLVDRKGNVIYKKTGYFQGDEEYLESLIRAAISD